MLRFSFKVLGVITFSCLGALSDASESGLVIVREIADLQRMTVAEMARVRVVGVLTYSFATGAGGGTFIWRDAVAAKGLEPNAVTIIAPSDGPGSCINGCLVRANRQSISLNDFGAFGDGKHDDFPAMDRAMRALQKDGGTLRIPAGTYAISSPIEPSTQGDACVNIEGDGIGATIIRAISPMKAIYSRPSGVRMEGCHVGGMTLDANKLARACLVKAGMPHSVWHDMDCVSATPDTQDGTNAQFLFGTSNGSLPGSDSETVVRNVRATPSRTGTVGIWGGYSTSDSSFYDIVAAGAGSKEGILVSGGNNAFYHAHCYPYLSVDFPNICISDYGIGNVYIATEIDGITGFGFNFGRENQHSIAVGTTFTYGGTVLDYSRARGFFQDKATGGNMVRDVGCGSYGGADVSKWSLLGDNRESKLIEASGISRCVSITTSPQSQESYHQ